MRSRKLIVRNMFHLTRAINPPAPFLKGGRGIFNCRILYDIRNIFMTEDR